MATIGNNIISLTVDDKARLTELINHNTGYGNIITRPMPLFRVILRSGDNWEDVAYASDAEMTISATDDKLEICVTALNTSAGRSDIEMTLSIRISGDKLWFDANIINRAKCDVNELFWPCVGAIKTLAGGKTGLMFPSGMGQYFTDISETLKGVDGQGGNKLITATYPAATMQWMSLIDGEQCLYFTGRDDQFYASDMRVVGSNEGDICLETDKFCFVAPGEEWTCPKYMMWLYEGAWQRGSEEYREWASAWRKPVKTKSWMKDMTGYFLVINKQQYGDEVFSYYDIPHLYELAQQHGINTLGLFGWFDTGHDNFYPDLTVSESMGGERALRESLQKVRDMGGRVTLYFQGHLIDVNTPYFKSDGLRVSGKDHMGAPYYEHYCKYSGSEFNRYYGGRTFATACPWCEDWHALLAQKADWIHDLGADGVLFDQTGGIMPYPCFDKSHGHPKPSVSFAQGRIRLLRHVRAAVDKHKDFCLMVEIMTDVYSQFIDCIHGTVNTGKGDRMMALNSKTPTSVSMPEMYRNTFPSTKLTHRVPRPYMEPRYINGALCYGAMFEMEVRYLKDREFVESNQRPEWKAYAKAVTERRQKYADLLLNGTYSCSPEWTKLNPNLKHGVFEGNGGMCVVLWNDNDAELPVTACGDRLKRWETIDAHGDGIPKHIAANSVLLLFD